MNSQRSRFLSNLSLSFISAIFIAFTPIEAESYKTVLRWDWPTLEQSGATSWDMLRYQFPKDFSWGVGDSAFQTEGTQTATGHCINNWTEFDNAPFVGTGCDRWTRYQEDINNIVACGFDAYRMSVEWSKIEPQEGVFDYQVLDHYRDVAQYAKDKGLKVMVVLWHHTWPIWFGNLGGWEPEKISIKNTKKTRSLLKKLNWRIKKKIQRGTRLVVEKNNNFAFVNYAEKVVQHLQQYVDVWIPLNEPDGYAMQGFFRGVYPPCKKDLTLAGKVIATMLDAHVATAKAIRKLAPQAHISITKVVQHIDPYRWWHPLEVAVTSLFDNLFNTSFINFFKDGTFEWYIPAKMHVKYENSDAHDSIDFFGVNYYSHSTIKINLAPPGADHTIQHPHEAKTDNGWVVYPEGLYRALQRCAEIGKPLLIAENGVADGTDQLRDLFIRQHLYALQLFLEEFTCPVIGYHYWSLTDNYEWMQGYKQKFGLYAIDREHNNARVLRESAQGFVNFVQQQRIAT